MSEKSLIVYSASLKDKKISNILDSNSIPLVYLHNIKIDILNKITNNVLKYFNTNIKGIIKSNNIDEYTKKFNIFNKKIISHPDFDKFRLNIKNNIKNNILSLPTLIKTPEFFIHEKRIDGNKQLVNTGRTITKQLLINMCGGDNAIDYTNYLNKPIKKFSIIKYYNYLFISKKEVNLTGILEMQLNSNEEENLSNFKIKCKEYFSKIDVENDEFIRVILNVTYVNDKRDKIITYITTESKNQSNYYNFVNNLKFAMFIDNETSRFTNNQISKTKYSKLHEHIDYYNYTLRIEKTAINKDTGIRKDPIPYKYEKWDNEQYKYNSIKITKGIMFYKLDDTYNHKTRNKYNIVFKLNKFFKNKLTYDSYKNLLKNNQIFDNKANINDIEFEIELIVPKDINIQTFRLVRLIKSCDIWDAHFTFEDDNKYYTNSNNNVYFDRNINNLIGIDDNSELYNIDMPQHNKKSKKLYFKIKNIQKRLSKNNNEINNKILKKYNKKRTNYKKTILQQECKKIVEKGGNIYLEKNNISNMTKSAKGNSLNNGKNVRAKSKLNRKLLDSNFKFIEEQLEKNTKRYGKKFVPINTNHSPSQHCPNCNTKYEKTNNYTYRTCSSCNLSFDRDIAANINNIKENKGHTSQQIQNHINKYKNKKIK